MFSGGEEEDRTPDLRIANATLSQLSYPPTATRSVAKSGAASAARTGVAHRHTVELRAAGDVPVSRDVRMSRYDTAWLDLQFNNRARVPEHPAIFDRWARESALARERHARRLDLPYGTSAGERLDLFPTHRRDAPVLVFIHGGWWRSLDKNDHSFIAPAFAAAGALVVVPNYALCPAVTIDTIALQMTQALAWVHRHAALYGGDPRRIVVAGHSAGGHLAAMLACCDWKRVGAELPARLLTAAVSISGLFDLEMIRQTPYLHGLGLTPASARRLSPLHYPAPRTPLSAFVGALESDGFLQQNDAIRAAWGRRAVPVCERIADAHHFDVLHRLADPRSPLHAHVLGLLGL